MKNFTLIFALLFTSFGFSQNTGELVIFSNLGDPFFVILNGEKQNPKAETNVKVQGLAPGFYSCKVLSENNLYSFDKNFEIKSGMLTSYRIVEKSGVPKLRYFSEVAINNQQTTGQSVVVYHPASTTNQTTTQTTNTNSTTTTVGSTTNTNTGGETINVGIQINENGMGTVVNTSGTGTEDVTQTTTVTTTTTSTSTQGNDGYNHNQHGDNHQHNGNQNHQNNNSHNMSNCLVDNDGLTKVVSLVKAESFSDNKLNIAKQFTKNKCLTVNQIKEIGTLFSFSEDKMEYVKYAYDYCLNTQDYYELNEIFTFSDDKDTLNGFISTK